LSAKSIVSYTPNLGIEFESKIAAYEFYNKHNEKMGFGIRREYGNKSKKDDIFYFKKILKLKLEQVVKHVWLFHLIGRSTNTRLLTL